MVNTDIINCKRLLYFIMVMVIYALNMHKYGKNKVLKEECWLIGAFQNEDIFQKKFHLKSKIEVKMKLPNKAM